jgi:hypothetical protein
MTPQELINKLVNLEGPCMRFCAYCPEEHDTAEIKECVEEMLRKIYVTQQCNDDLMKELIKIRKAYKDVTGFEYRDD